MHFRETPERWAETTRRGFPGAAGSLVTGPEASCWASRCRRIHCMRPSTVGRTGTPHTEPDGSGALRVRHERFEMGDRPPRLRRGDAAVDHLHNTIRTRGDARIVRHEQNCQTAGAS